MQQRDYTTEDAPTVERWHAASGFEFIEPREDEAYATRKVALYQGRPAAIGFARMTVEIYGYVDPELSPAMKLEALRVLHQAIGAELKRQGIRTAHAWLPPTIAKAFGRKLRKFFGWNQPHAAWPCYVKDLF